MNQWCKYTTGQWVLASCNRFWLSHVYLFSIWIKCAQFILRKKYWRFHHALRVEDGRVIEIVGSGRQEPTLQEWVNRQNRTVAIFRPVAPFQEVEQLPYAFFDIVQLMLHNVRKLLNIGHSWNGVDGVPAKRKGHFCSEEVAKAIGRKDAHLILPCQCWELPELLYIETLPTRKGAVFPQPVVA